MIAVLVWFLHSTEHSVIMKVDDDVMLDPRRLDQVITLDVTSSLCCLPESSHQPVIWGIWGHGLHSTPVLRSGRYAVTKDQFPDTTYPSYAMGGFYAISRAAVNEMLNNFGSPSSKPLLHIEDVAITGQLRERAGLGLVNKWQEVLPWLGIKNRNIGEEQIIKAVVVYLQFVQGGQEGVEAMAAWVWNTVWGRNYTQTREHGESYIGQN